jgi:hypothetical protein
LTTLFGVSATRFTRQAKAKGKIGRRAKSTARQRKNR